MPPKKTTATKPAPIAAPKVAVSKVTKSKAPAKTPAAKKSAEDTLAKLTNGVAKKAAPKDESAKPAVDGTAKTSKRKADDIEEPDSPAEPKSKKSKGEERPKAPLKKTVAPKKAAAPKKVAVSKKVVEKEPEPASESESLSELEEEEEKVAQPEPAPKKAAQPKKTAVKAAPKKVPAPKKTAAKKAPAVKKPAEPESESEAGAEPEPEVKKAAAPKRAAPKKAIVAKAAKPAKVLPTINQAPTQILDVYVFGEGSAGELGLGAFKGPDGKKVIDVTRPRLNPRLSAQDVGVVALAVGGMHCVALTKDNKILTWGVNDQGALGRETPQEGKMKEVGENRESEDSDSDDSDDDDSGLNPSEAEPREVDLAAFPEGTKFASVYAGDSTSWVVTTTGLLYGWGTFRSNDGILGFREHIHTQRTPMLIPELKNIKTLAVGTNHVIALDSKGKTTVWGAGEQGQLARRVVSRTATGALMPREFGLQRKKIAFIGAGDYHSFAIDDKGNVYSWGLNSFGQTGVPKDEETEENTVGAPTLVRSLEEFDVKQIVGGAHHTIACTTKGEVLLWGRIDNKQGGMEIDEMDKDSLYFDEGNKPRFLTRPAVIPDIKGAYVATGNDTCIAIATDGKAYSWGFSTNYQTGQGHAEDVVKATWIDNSAVRGKKLTFAGVGGQFGVVAGEHTDTPMTNGV